MTVAARRNVVAEIAERRRADILAEVAATDPAVLIDAALASNRTRPIVDRLAVPGLPHRAGHRGHRGEGTCL